MYVRFYDELSQIAIKKIYILHNGMNNCTGNIMQFIYNRY